MSHVYSGDQMRTQAGGSICPACRLCADLGVPHVCITAGGLLDELLIKDSAEHLVGSAEQLVRLQEELELHPARPYIGDGRVRPVDRSWCFCRCDKRREAA